MFYTTHQKALHWFLIISYQGKKNPPPSTDYGRERKEEEAKTPPSKRPNHKTHIIRFLFQTHLRRKRPPLRRPIHRQILHHPPRTSPRTSQPPLPPPSTTTNHHPQPPHHHHNHKTPIPIHHRFPPHKLHNPSPPRLAHPHIRPRNKEIQSAALRFRVGEDESGCG
ncbi:unnamed protein product [Camellia sinensis]